MQSTRFFLVAPTCLNWNHIYSWLADLESLEKLAPLPAEPQMNPAVEAMTVAVRESPSGLEQPEEETK